MTDLAWDEAGAGPPVVLVHGFACDRRMWDGQVRALASTYRTIRYDLRGFGASPMPDGPYDHAGDLAGIVDTLSLDRPLVVGLSLGANVALNFARRFPGAVRGIVLAAPGLPGHAWTTERPPEAAAAHARAHGIAAGREFWLNHPLFASLDAAPGARAVTAAMVRGYSGWHWQNPDPQAVPDLASHLGSIDTPALVISGALDDPGYRQIARRLAAELPDVRLEELPAAGHMVNLEAEDSFNRLILDFAGQHPASREGMT